jgi:type VI secretion system protein ImpJ
MSNEEYMTRQTTPADIPYGIQWSEGLLLSPQHFQQNDRFWQARLRYLIECANPDFVGVRSLELDEGLLEKGRVVVRSLECVLDDGTPILLQLGRDSALEFDATAVSSEAGDPVRIAIVLPWRGDAAAARGSMYRRYESVRGLTALDENTGSTAVPISRLKPIVRLDHRWAPGTDLLAGCYLLELQRTSLGTYRRTAYHPPLATLGASSFLKDQALQRRVEAVRDLVRTKLREIAQAGESASVSASAGDSYLAMAARCLATILPGLDVLGLGADVAPRQVYLMLSDATGRIASLDALPDPPALPPYNHSDCQPGFDVALKFIETRVRAIRPRFERLPFDRDGNGGFSITLPPDAGDALLIEVRPAAGQHRDDLEDWLARCTIGHPRLLDELDKRRMPGAVASRSTADGKGLDPAALYYEIGNAAFDFSEGMRHVFTGGERLTIRGGGRHAVTRAPAEIVLYRASVHAKRSDAEKGGHHGEGNEGHREPPADASRHEVRPNPSPSGQGAGHEHR